MTVRGKIIFMCVCLGGIQLVSVAAETWFARRSAAHQSASRKAHEQLAQLAQIEAGLVWQLKEIVEVSVEAAQGDATAGEAAAGEAAEADEEQAADDVQELAEAQERIDTAHARFTTLAREEQELSDPDDSFGASTASTLQLAALTRELRVAVNDVAARVAEGRAALSDHRALEVRFRRAIASLQQVLEAERRAGIEQDRAANRWALRATTMAWLTPLLSALMLLATLALVLRSISRPLSDLLVGASRVARGDLESPVPVRSDDELGQLAGAFNDMQLSLVNRIAERDLALRDARFRELSEAAPVAIAELDGASRPVYVNRRWTVLVGAEAAPDQPWTDLVHPDDRARADALRREAAGAAEELRLRRGDTTAWVVAQAARLGGDENDRTIMALADVTAQKLALARAEQLGHELISASRKAGMAEVSAGVLHNVGNVLNSIVVSAGALKEQLRGSQVTSLVKATRLLEENAGDLDGFLATERGKLLPPYLVKVASHLSDELVHSQEDLSRIEKGVEHIRAIISTQQSYAKNGTHTENLRLSEVIEDVIKMHAVSFDRQDVRIARHFEADPELHSDRHKIMQILLNLVSNARHALDAAQAQGDRTIAITTRRSDEGKIALEVADNGVGISPENLARLFEHGFTTRKTGHGFGLHSSVRAAQELGGRLTATSEGTGRGASFLLELPIAAEERAA